MAGIELRKIVLQIEETLTDAGQSVSPPSRKVTVAAVIANPFANAQVEDLAPLYDLGNELSTLLVERAMKALDASPEDIGSYGKAAIIGLDGEIEHAAALIHPKFGAPVRAATAGSDIIPSTKKLGAPGAAITVPLTGKESIWSFDHMDATEIAVPDAPRANEAVVILSLGIGGRPRHRIKLPSA